MKKIRITVITRNSDYLQRLANRLCEEKDMSLFSSIVINNFKSEMKQSIAFLEQTFLTQPDVLLLDQTILRDAAAIDVQQVLAYRDKLNSTKFIIVGERYNEESVMHLMSISSPSAVRKNPLTPASISAITLSSL